MESNNNNNNNNNNVSAHDLIWGDVDEKNDANKIVQELISANRIPFTREEHNRARLRFRLEHAEKDNFNNQQHNI